ncbi:hypothetical protein [Brevibacillus sp. SYSU BS000544]|uniref:hypothetical protein n=1 Tax=Brevibacillus sp. SYSU BS000544 TaxID=3416443 RepID=UPI003CE52678
MITPNILAEYLSDVIAKPLFKLKPHSFMLSHTESAAIGSATIPEIKQMTYLALRWEDGTVSQHQLALEELASNGLPLDAWRTSRYFAKSLPEPARSLPDHCYFDQQIACIIHHRQIPDWMDRYHYKLLHIKNIIFQSTEMEHKKDWTQIKLQIPGYWIDFQSSHLPNESEQSYLDMESLWLQKALVHPLPTNYSNRSFTWVLLSPDAVAALLSQGNAQAREWYETKKRGKIWLYQEWMNHQEEILYVPRLHLLQAGQTQPSFHAYTPEAYVYTEGLPFAKIPFTFRFRLSAFATPEHETHLVKKVGWSGYGLAVPRRLLEVTS